MSKILITDDSWLTRRSIKRILQGEGYDISEAQNGLEALTFINETDENIDLLVLDLLMPEMSGIEVLEKLKHDQIRIPVLVMTADIQKTVKQNCIALGADAFLNKPPEPEELIEVISDLLNNRADG